MKSIKIFICDDCTVVFQVYGVKHKKRFYCPKCGDTIAVVPYQAERYSETTTKIRWKPEEVEVLDLVIKGQLHSYQAAIILGRSTNSVVKKVNRMRKEAKLNENPLA